MPVNESTAPRLLERVVPVSALSSSEIERLLELMHEHYEDVDPATFRRDLEAKPHAITLATPEGRICGFSTVALLEAVIDGRRVRAVFSGDTVVDREHWGTSALARAWCRFVDDVVRGEPADPWYWFLVTKGYRTFHYLPLYFRRYHPSPESDGRDTDFEQSVLRHLARQRFGSSWHEDEGVVRVPGDYRLRPRLADLGLRRSSDPHVAFFEARNPHWRRGDELACLADLAPDNRRAAWNRLLQDPVPR